MAFVNKSGKRNMFMTTGIAILVEYSRKIDKMEFSGVKMATLLVPDKTKHIIDSNLEQRTVLDWLLGMVRILNTLRKLSEGQASA